MSIKSKVFAVVGVAALASGFGAAGANPAAASTPLVTATTSITNNPDSGGNGAWAYDDVTRTLTINVDITSSDCAPLSGFTAASDVCYSATVADTGQARTIVSAFQPNQGSATAADQTGDKITGPSEAVPFTGTASFQFYAPTGTIPSAADVPASRNDNNTVQSGAASTSQWYLEAFTQAAQGSVHGAIGNWSWVYADSCEKWTDSNTNGAGQSTPLSDDGNITGKVCPGAPAVSAVGDLINTYGNGPDVRGQVGAVNNRIIAWPVTGNDPAVRFQAVSSGNGWAFEYDPAKPSNLCVSEAVGSEPSGSAPTGLVLRVCNGGPWQRFRVDLSGGSSQLVNAATGHVIQPNGTGAQLTGVTKVTNPAGSWFAWNKRGVPAS